MTKFRVSFTITAETMFHMMSKFLPIDDLSVVEQPLVERAKLAQPKPAIVTQQKLVGKWKIKPKHKTRSIDMKKGINSVIADLLSDGKPHRAMEIGPLIKARGYSPNSVTSRLDALQAAGLVKKVDIGTWILVESNPKVA